MFEKTTIYEKEAGNGPLKKLNFVLQVDETGSHIAGAGFWGHCSQACPGANSSPPAVDAVAADENAKLQEELQVRSNCFEGLKNI